jgi:hypothetical protein
MLRYWKTKDRFNKVKGGSMRKIKNKARASAVAAEKRRHNLARKEERRIKLHLMSLGEKGCKMWDKRKERKSKNGKRRK